MVSYYNPLAYTQKHSASNLNYPAAQHWQWPTNYTTTANHQLLSDLESSHHQVYYNPHMFHSTGNSSAEWHSPLPTTENLLPGAPNVQQIVNESNNGAVIGSCTSSGPTTNSIGPTATEISASSETRRSIADHHDSLLPPSLNISANNVRSPEAPSTRSPDHISNSSNNSTCIGNIAYNNQTSPAKAQYYEWMKKPSYPAQPAPECGMDTESLFLIKEGDINELFPLSLLETRIKFKQRLANLKENQIDYSSMESSNSYLS